MDAIAKWGCLGALTTIALVVVGSVALIWWITWRLDHPPSLTIRNDSDVLVHVGIDKSSARVDIPPHTEVTVTPESYHDPNVQIQFGTDSTWCNWLEVRKHQPLLITNEGPNCVEVRTTPTPTLLP